MALAFIALLVGDWWEAKRKRESNRVIKQYTDVRNKL
jgi:hypothetical protein